MLKKFSKVVFALLSVCLVATPLVPTNLSAQTVTESTVPLIIKINSTAYSEKSREVIVHFTVENKSGSFVDNLRYNFEFYNGEKLETDGLLFRNLQYVFSTSDSLEKLAPNESRNHTIKYKVPETIPGGNYFFRASVYNEELSFYGITYTKEPLHLTGRGTFITSKSGRLVDVENKKVYPLMAGPTLEKDKSYVIAFVRSENPEMFELIDENAIFSDIKISHVTDNDEVVYEENDVPLQSLLREDDLGIEFKIEPWENIKSGAHTVFINFKNARGEQISESTSVRLLYRGLLGRIVLIDTNINSYRRGEPINLVVNTTVAGDENASKAFVKTFLKSEGKVVQEVEKEIILNKTFEGTRSIVDFRDVDIKSKSIIDEIEVILTSESGEILDTQTIQMDPTKVFEYPKDTSWVKNILISVVLLIVAIGILAYVKKKTNLTVVSILIAASVIGGSVLFSAGTGLVMAQEEEYWNEESGEIIYEYVCLDSSATNFYGYETHEGIIEDNSMCMYEEQYEDDTAPADEDPYGSGDVCMNEYADNYGGALPCTYENNPGANPDQGEEYCWDINAANYGSPEACWYHMGCTDPSAYNYDAAAMIDDGSCYYEQDPGEQICGENGYWGEECEESPIGEPIPGLYRELTNVWLDGSTQIPQDAICTEGCKAIEFYVKVQCQECLNEADTVSVSFDNNTSIGSSIHDRVWNFDSSGGAGVDVQYNMYTVGLDDELKKQSETLAYKTELQQAQENNLAGYPVYANDIINEWIYGPFVANFCPDNVDDEGNMIPEISSDGEYSQSFNVLVNTSFSADFCKADVGINSITQEVTCRLPGELRASFYLDNDEDGLKDSDEFYLRSTEGSESCIGETGAPFGLIRNLMTQEAFGELDSTNCSEDGVPYFFKNLLDPGDYETGIDTDNSFGLIKTGVEYLVDSLWRTDNFITIGSDGIRKSRIGVKIEHPGGVAISCVADPKYSEDVAPYVTWGIKMISDSYDMEDLVFVWEGIGEAPSVTERNGNNNQGSYSITYPKANGTENHRIKVFAKSASTGEVVSNTATCQMYVSPFLVSCAAYTSLEDSVPDTAFNVGDDVYWKASVINGNAPMTYAWSSAGDESSNANYLTSYSEANAGTAVETELTVVDSRGYERNTSCTIFVRECVVNDECPGDYVCSGLGMCVLPPPSFSRELTLNPGITNEGGTCGLSWIIDGATSCELKRNNDVIDIGDQASSSTGTLDVDPGTYTMSCTNGEDLIAQSGPVRCLVNPNIREN